MTEIHTKLLQEIEKGGIPIDDSTITLLNELLITPGHECSFIRSIASSVPIENNSQLNHFAIVLESEQVYSK